MVGIKEQEQEQEHFNNWSGASAHEQELREELWKKVLNELNMPYQNRGEVEDYGYVALLHRAICNDYEKLLQEGYTSEQLAEINTTLEKNFASGDYENEPFPKYTPLGMKSQVLASKFATRTVNNQEEYINEKQ